MLSDEALMEQFTKQVAWQNFFATQVAQAELEEAEAEADLKLEEAKSMLRTPGKVTDARVKRDADPEVFVARKVYRTARAKRKLLEVTMDNRERCATLISRELTRRLGRENLGRRADKWRP
jgi:hypothetical protein